MLSLARRLGVVAAALAAASGLAALATGAPSGELRPLGAGALALLVASAAWRAFRASPRAPAAFGWGAAVAFLVAALALPPPLGWAFAAASVAFALAAGAASAFRWRTRRALT